jgi:late competence protein required for DNA uptake (superfamily II DNA/RNA helicase)
MTLTNICLKPFKHGSIKLLMSKAFFGFLFTKVLGLDLAPHHKDMANKLMSKNNQVFFLAARGHGKTELVSVAYPIWLCLNKGSDNAQPFQICIISSRDDQTTKIMQRIKNYITM